MTRHDNHRAKPVRVNRIERLETRHMLSADGLSVDCFHDEFADELARTTRSLQALRGSDFDHRGAEQNRIRQRPGDQTLRLLGDDHNHRNENHVRSGSSDGSRERPGRHFGRDHRRYEPQIIPPIADASIAEGELLTNSSLVLASPPAQRIEPVSIQSPITSSRISPITSSRITFIVFLPSVTSSLSRDSGASRSATDSLVQSRAAPPTVATVSPVVESPSADSPTANSPAADSPLPGDPVQGLTPAEQAEFARAEAVQLVAVRQHSDFSVAATNFDAPSEVLNTNSGGLPKLDFSFDVLRFDHMPLDQILQQSKSLEDDFAELEELLDAIALERIESMQHRDNATRSIVAAEKQADTMVESPPERVSDGMILLLPGGTLANPTVQFAGQVFDRPDDSAISQWTVGVGFYRALEVVGDNRFAEALIASDISIDPINTATAQNEVADVFAWQSDSASSSRQAAGLVFCCLGIQYLRKRRKHMEHNGVAERFNPPGEGSID